MGLNLVNISKSYNDTRAVDDVTLSVPAGKIMALVGPSGCGKTTLLRVIAGLVEPDRGKVILGGQDISGLAPYRRPTATVFQSYALFPHLNVFDNISYGLKTGKRPPAVIKPKVEEIMDLMKISNLSRRRVNELSGGQQQRVALARALVVEPKVLLFDEPLSSLDARLRIEMREEIRKIQQKTSITSIYVTHDQEEALAIAAQVAVMNEGKIEQVGAPYEIYRSPETPFVAGFVGSGNLVPAKVTGILPHGFEVQLMGLKYRVENGNHLSVNVGDRIRVFFRPENVAPSSSGRWPAWVQNTTFLGSLVRYYLDTRNGLTQSLIMDLPLEKASYRPGEKLMIDIANSVRVFAAD